jgi:hypothetical protein
MALFKNNYSNDFFQTIVKTNIIILCKEDRYYIEKGLLYIVNWLMDMV